jgi:hypothetical protein
MSINKEITSLLREHREELRQAGLGLGKAYSLVKVAP